jgi:hypothetical protein
VNELFSAVLAEQHDERTEGRRCLGLEVLAKSRLAAAPPHHPSTIQEPTTSQIPALSA